MEDKELSITNIPAISAVYFALIQCGYNFYSIERDTSIIEKLRSFIAPQRDAYGFFSAVEQNTCEVYPYWPRASMLETATFYIDSSEHYVDFNAYKNSIMSAKNISDIERNQSFWNWITEFPEALKHILHSSSFSRYLEWEDDWIAQQNIKYQKELKRIGDILELCKDRFMTPIQNIRIVLNPIKCVYSADYHLKDNNFIFCSGSLSEKAVIHEFIHHIVHPIVESRKGEILSCNLARLDIDISYYLNNDKSGKLNAFEEHMVRVLTDEMLIGNVPENLNIFFDQEIIKL